MKKMTLKTLAALGILAALCLLVSIPAGAVAVPAATPVPGGELIADDPSERPTLSDYFPFNLVGDMESIENATTTIEIMLLLTVLSLAPSILIMMTAFTRIIIVLSFTRNAMGTQQMPPNQILVGLALFLTFFVMQPVFDEIKTNAWDPYAAEEISFEETIERTMGPIRNFMFEQIRLQGHEGDLRNFILLSRGPEPQTIDDIPTHVLIPAFITSEMKTAFIIGFLIYLPFIVIDMVVASALMSMGMMMLPPVMISLPFKIMLFVVVDGWNLTVNSLVETFLP